MFPQLTAALNTTGSLVVAILNVSVSTPEVNPNCLDYLAEWQLKPESLEFQHCQPATQVNHPTKLTAIYHVPGSHAAGVEDFLHQEFGMARIRHICCSWHGHPWGDYRDKQGQSYNVLMYSEETLLQQRSDWPQISTFEVVVEPVDA
ncbi:MAG: DUF4952 domain-containing protein [Spirulina sp. SIO3F2]|nr:DUF4952 domain-containing protein [Spirulina sp. SIO3F2]